MSLLYAKKPPVLDYIEKGNLGYLYAEKPIILMLSKKMRSACQLQCKKEKKQYA